MRRAIDVADGGGGEASVRAASPSLHEPSAFQLCVQLPAGRPCATADEGVFNVNVKLREATLMYNISHCSGAAVTIHPSIH